MRTLVAVHKILLLLLLVAFLLSFAGRWHFMLDNLSSFRVHFALAFAVVAVGFLLTRELDWLALAGAGLLVSLLPIAPWFLSPAADVVYDGQRVSVLSTNVSARNGDPAKLLALIEREQPDVLGIVELTPRYLDGLAAVRARYPHRFEAPQDDYWGMALYSRLPLADARVARFGDDGPPAITATLQSGDVAIEVVLLHPYPPMTATLAGQRNAQLQAVAGYLRRSGQRALVLGDLNTAMWSPHYRDFVATAGLSNARKGQGVAGTWPPFMPLGVPIDHILLSDSLHARDFRVLSGVGSDHLPVTAEIVLPVALNDGQAPTALGRAGGTQHADD